MTSKQRALAKPKSVRIVLRVYCAKLLLNVPLPISDEHYAATMVRALDWWDETWGEAPEENTLDEEEVAQLVIQRLQGTEWAKIIEADVKEGTN